MCVRVRACAFVHGLFEGLAFEVVQNYNNYNYNNNNNYNYNYNLP